MQSDAGPTADPVPGGIAQALAEARAHHEAGRLREAEAICRDVLHRVPDEPDALYRLGVLTWQAGRADAAIDLLDRAVALRPDAADYHLDLGNVLQASGRLDDALASFRRTTALAPANADAHFNAGTVLQQLGHDDEAAASYAEALRHAPDLADAHVNLGTLHERAGRFDDALTQYRRALAISPRSVHALYNLGNAMCTLGRYADAAAAYNEGLVTRPDYMPLHYGLARALEGLGRIDDAIARYRRALRLAPRNASLHNDLGAALARAGLTRDACAAFRAAIEVQPELSEAHINLGHALNALGDVAGAVASHRRALALRDTPQIGANLAHSLRALEADGVVVPDADALLVLALERRWARPDDLARAVARRMDAAGLRADDLAGLARNRLLCALLVRAPVVGASLERLLTAARRNLIDAALAGDLDPDSLDFACTLARQCFINEYVFACDDDEAARALALRDEIAAALERGEAVPPQHLAAVAAYVALGTIRGVERALDRAWPVAVHALLAQQVTEPLDDARRSATIERLTDIRDPVSLRVQRQYEENPYPRWTDVAVEAPSISPDAWLRQRLPGASFRAVERREAPDILVAGCGTGREAIEMAQRFPGARVLAIDLSRASLAYAARKRDALGLGNVHFAQADIAALESSGDSFDVVSSVGVLHHMAEPTLALRTLVSRLRPGGFLQIGLYSEPARRHVEAAQRFVASRGFAADAEGIRRARIALRDADDARRFASVVESPDFYTTSECRDLLFHAHETRFTLLQVRDMLRDAGVRMIGFVLDPRVQARYAAEFPQDPDRTSFERWSAFEARHPDTFIGMYVLWAQKP